MYLYNNILFKVVIELNKRTEYLTGNIKNSDIKYEVVNENFENIYFKMMSQIKKSGYIPFEVKYFSDEKELDREEIPYYLQLKKIESDRFKKNLFDNSNKLIAPEYLIMSVINIEIKSFKILNNNQIKMFEGQIHINDDKISFSLICKKYFTKSVNVMKPSVIESKKKRIQKLRERIGRQEDRIKNLQEKIDKYKVWLKEESEKIDKVEVEVETVINETPENVQTLI